MLRDLYARVHGAETRVIDVQGDDGSPRSTAIPVLESLPVRSVTAWVRVGQGYWEEPGNPALIIVLEYPSMILDIQATVAELQSPLIRDRTGALQSPHLAIGIRDGEGFTGLDWADRTFFAYSDSTFDTQTFVSAPLELDFTRPPISEREPVDRLGAVLTTRLRPGLVPLGRAGLHVQAGFTGSRFEGRPITYIPRHQKGAALVTLTYVDGNPGGLVPPELVPLLLAPEPL